MEFKNHIQELLSAYTALIGETESAQAFRLFLRAFDDVSNRSNLAGHVTGSALVWHRSTNTVLRVHHAKLNRWVFSAGGHVEPGELPWQASERELREETGITATRLFDVNLPVPLLFDAHPIPASVKKGEPAHWHYDMVYLYGVEAMPEIKADPTEITHYHWVNLDDVTRANSPIDLREQMTLHEVG